MMLSGQAVRAGGGAASAVAGTRVSAAAIATTTGSVLRASVATVGSWMRGGVSLCGCQAAAGTGAGSGCR
ncbi:MAG: hypothetical protein QOI78_5699 [Actinomycetota bacterium]|jgi:hypothetical protein|nr:hypothetical protein [Actinomycetota bacterium]